MFRGIILAALSFVFVTSVAYGASTNVKAQGELRCQAFFDAPVGGKDLPLVIALNGTGLYSMGKSSSLHPGVRYLLETEKSVSVVSFNKPGIRLNKSSATGYDLHTESYDKHTQDDLVQCTYNAIMWALTQPQVQNQAALFFVGHSEGSQIAVRTLLKLRDEKPELLQRVQAMYLSGLPMIPWKDMLKQQVSAEQIKKIEAAIEKEDNELLLRQAGGIPASYWKNVFKSESLAETLAKAAPSLKHIIFHVYQGLKDANTRAEPLMEFEERNLRRFSEGKDHVRWTARYYNSGHELNDSAVNDVVFSMQAYLTPSRSLIQ